MHTGSSIGCSWPRQGPMITAGETPEKWRNGPDLTFFFSVAATNTQDVSTDQVYTAGRLSVSIWHIVGHAKAAFSVNSEAASKTSLRAGPAVHRRPWLRQDRGSMWSNPSWPLSSRPNEVFRGSRLRGMTVRGEGGRQDRYSEISVPVDWGSWMHAMHNDRLWAAGTLFRYRSAVVQLSSRERLCLCPLVA